MPPARAPPTLPRIAERRPGMHHAGQFHARLRIGHLAVVASIFSIEERKGVQVLVPSSNKLKWMLMTYIDLWLKLIFLYQIISSRGWSAGGALLTLVDFCCARCLSLMLSEGSSVHLIPPRSGNPRHSCWSKYTTSPKRVLGPGEPSVLVAIGRCGIPLQRRATHDRCLLQGE